MDARNHIKAGRSFATIYSKSRGRCPQLMCGQASALIQLTRTVHKWRVPSAAAPRHEAPRPQTHLYPPMHRTLHAQRNITKGNFAPAPNADANLSANQKVWRRPIEFLLATGCSLLPCEHPSSGWTSLSKSCCSRSANGMHWQSFAMRCLS